MCNTYTVEEIEKMKRRNKKQTVGDWMIKNLGEDSIEKYWSECNQFSPFDISSGSNMKVCIKCQNKEYHSFYKTSCNNFINGNRCPYCSSKKVHPKDSFAQWLIDNYGENAIQLYWSNKNIYNPWEISVGGEKRIWIKCQTADYHEDYDVLLCNFTKGCRCPYCVGKKTHPKDSFAQWGIDNYGDDFLEKYWSSLNILDPWEIPLGSKKEVLINCQKNMNHDSYLVSVQNFVAKNFRCPYCSGRQVATSNSLGSYIEESFGIEYIQKLWSDKNSKTPYEYTKRSNVIVYWNCENDIHEDFERSINESYSKGFRCPKCVAKRRESFLQEKVRLYISDILNYRISHEHHTVIKCVNYKTNTRLLYDNEVFIENDIKLIIEVHGKHHYIINGHIMMSAKEMNATTEEALDYQQWKDQYKKEYALSQGYCYLEIPYWTDNDDEEWKQLIDNKIKEILHNN